MNKLIIAEKPSVALRIALSLSGSRPRRNAFNGVGYYETERDGDTLFIVAAAGHLFSLHQSGKSRELPIFETEWIASYRVNAGSYFTKKYLDAIEEVGKKCGFFINACDYDLEGTVIGSNLIKQVIKRDVNSSLEISSTNIARMRFSTTTGPDLEHAYENLDAFDFNNLYAGEARHILDWMWGINLSRALMQAIALAGTKKVMSIGRVQGPTLAILARRELEIKEFVSKPYWRVVVNFGGVEFENTRGSVFEKRLAEEALKTTKENEVVVKKIERKEEMRGPFPPFDLTSLQLEASRVFRMDPSRTLAIAQVLYERSYVSYPRTASQRLPPTLNLRRIISLIAQNEKYRKLAEHLMKNSRYRPREGQREDEAHPAIYPTGEPPKRLTDEEERVYDLITRRFIACFAEHSRIENTRILLAAGREEYTASGNVVKERGWLDFYGYYRPDEMNLPALKEDMVLRDADAKLREAMTEPPKRYTKTSLIGLLEKKELGTKATRAAIIDTLFKRGYIMNASIGVTEFGMSVYGALSRYCTEILDEELTRKLEEDMEGIAHGKIRRDEVINEGRGIITRIMGSFKKNQREIGMELTRGLKESERASVLGKCIKDGGDLVIKRSRARKVFVGCANWPKCDVTYPLPQYAKIVPLHKVCEICKTPKVKVFSKGKVFEMDLDPNCESKKNWKRREEPKVQTATAVRAETKTKGKAKRKAEKAKEPKKDD